MKKLQRWWVGMLKRFGAGQGYAPPDQYGTIRCLECNGHFGTFGYGINGGQWRGHRPTCSRLSRAALAAYAVKLEQQVAELRLECNSRYVAPWANKMRQNLNYWHGKYLILRQENNALRRKLRRMTEGGDGVDGAGT